MNNRSHTGFRPTNLLLGVGISLFLLVVNLNIVAENRQINFFLIGSLVLAALVFFMLRYREQTMYFMVFTIPLSLDVSIGESSSINGPSELIAVALCLYFIVVQFAGRPLPRDIIRHPISWLLAADVLWMLCTSCFSQMWDVSLKRWIVRVVYVAVYYFMFAELFLSDPKQIPKVFVYYVLGLIVPMVYYLVQHQAIGFAIVGSTMLCRPFYNDHTVFGAALAFFLPFLYYYTFRRLKTFPYRFFFLVLGGLLIVATFFSYSRAAWLSLICATAVYLIFKWRIKARVFLGGIALVFIAGFFLWEPIFDAINRNRVKSHGGDVGQHFQSVTNISTDASNTERINRWKCAWRMFEAKPLTGFGPGTFQFFYGQYQVSSDLNFHSTYAGDKGHAHSEYLNYLSETGLPGLIIFLVLLVLVFSTARRLLLSSRESPETYNLVMVLTMGLVTFYVHSFFNGFIESDKMAMPLFVSLAAFTAIDIASKRKQSSSVLQGEG